MKKNSYITFVIFLLLVNLFTYSQSADSSKNSLEKGSFGLLFSIGANFNLGSIDGAMFSGKYHLSNRIAIRLGTGLSLSKQDAQIIIDHGESKPIERESSGYSLTSYFVYYLIKKNIINPYIAAGPLYSYSMISDMFQSTNYYESHERIDKTYGAGILFGAEWFFIKNMSLFAEYNPSIQFISYDKQSYKNDNGFVISYIERGDITKISSNNARLGLGVYF
jgi:hypothetical protein